MSQTYRYPASSASVTISAIGTNGASNPATSIQVGGKSPSNTLLPLSVDASGVLNVNVSAVPANQTVDLNKVGGAAISLGQKLTATSLPVVLASDQSALAITVAALPLPSGAATSAKQDTGNTSLASIDSKIVAVNTGAVVVSSSALPTGAATETTLAAASAKLPATLGQKAMSASMAVALASDQSSIPVAYVDPTASGAITTQNLNPTSGVATASSTVAVTLTGQTTLAIQVTGTYTGALTIQGTVDGTNWVAVSSVMNNNTGAILPSITSALQSIFQVVVGGYAQVRVTALAAMTGTATVTLRASNAASLVALDAPIPAGTNIIGALSANQSANVAQINGVTPLMGNGVTGTGSQRVTIASDNTAFSVNAVQSGTWTVQPGNTANTTPWLVNQQTTASSAVTSVASSATSVSILASNASRKGAMVYNDSTANLYLKLGATASATSFTVLIPAGGYYELPNTRLYTGAIDGIWASANGNARITELS